ATRWRLLRPLPVAAGLATLVLLTAGTVRAAGWLYVLCVLTALGLSSYGLAAGRRWTSVLVGGFLAPIALLRGLPWLLRGIRLPSRHSRGAGVKQGKPTNGTDALRIAAVITGTMLLVLVFGSLFASADAAFGQLVDNLFANPVPEELVPRAFFGVAVAGFALGAAFLARVPPRLDRLGTRHPRPVRRWEWLVPLTALVVLFASFVAVQLTVLFGGHPHVLRTAGLTYAEYARQGFAQLVLVTLLTLGVLAAVGRWAPRRTPLDRALLRLVGGALCVLTLVIVASALYRLHLYQQAYGFTRLRLLVDAFELWLGGMFVLILAAGARLRGGWLPRAVVATGVAMLLGLTALNPDGFIADRNLARYQDTGKLDTYYLGYLSADAVPALDRLPEPQRSCALRPIVADLKRDEPWYAYNLSRERARDLLAAHPVHPDATC
ncbi:MAG: DUF4153 domain-containing protein, partial [Micromonosporaceae bacterium]